MPVKKSTRDLPLEVKTMPVAARAIFRSAFNSAIKEKPESMAALLALAAVKKEFTRTENEEGEEEWVKKEEAQQQREAEIEEAVGAAREEDEDDDEKVQRKGRAAAEEDPEYEKASNVIKAARAISVAAAPAGGAADSSNGDDILMTDTMTLDKAGFRLTPDGYLVANPRVARSGIQLYRGIEVGRPDMAEVRVYCPEGEVFHTAAMASLAHRPITLDHPDTKVDATNWRKLAVGKSDGDVARDGDFIRVPLVLMDAGAIMAAQSGKSQLSVGYGAKLVWGAGQAPDGQMYDAMQTEIRANHIALVTSARGGDKLKIGDGKRTRAQGSKPEGEGDHHGQQRRNPMTDKILNLDGVNIALDERDGQILERHLAGLQTKLKDCGENIEDLEKKIEDIEADLTEASKAVAKDGEIAVLKKKVEDSRLTDEEVDRRVNERLDVVARAQRVLGDQWSDAKKSLPQIRREVVAAHLGDQRAKEFSDDHVIGAFLSITDEPQQRDGIHRVVQTFSRPPVNSSINDAAAKAYDKRNQDLANRWKRNKTA